MKSLSRMGGAFFLVLFVLALSSHGRENRLEVERLSEVAGSAVRLRWPTVVGVTYDLQRSVDLHSWESVPGFPAVANGVAGQHDLSVLENRGFFRVVAGGMEDATELVRIPAGSFLMGDHFAEGMSSELPVHEVILGAYRIGRYPVTWDVWRIGYAWAVENGYDFDNSGAGKSGDHPVHSINWYDIIKWCNAWSERNGLEPVYFLDAARTTVYRRGRENLERNNVDWEANGFRLPTEAEWEKAARGGLIGRRFPRGDAISHERANYWADFPGGSYDESYPAGFHPDFAQGILPYTNPVGFFPPNGFGIHDMAGNVWERCWDWFGEDYYAVGETWNPVGPVDGNARILRGGGWVISAWSCRVSDRFFSSPSDTSNSWGFRVAKTGRE